MKSIVTGGKGFIGSHLAKKLLLNGDEVIVIDNNTSNSGSNNITQGITYYNLNLQHFNKILPIFKNVDRVFHLAADISIDYCNKNSRIASTNNVNTTINVLECAKLCSIKKVIFSSTSAVYKEKNDSVSYVETDETCGINIYSASKLYGENICKIYSTLYGIETICLRYFNVYGSGMSISPYSSVISKFLENKNKNKPLIITGDGNQTRDFIHVDDVVDANILASTTSLYQYGDVFNVGTGNSITINQLASFFKSPYIQYINCKKNELKHSCSNINKIKLNLKWDSTTAIEKWVSLNI